MQVPEQILVEGQALARAAILFAICVGLAILFRLVYGRLVVAPASRRSPALGIVLRALRGLIFWTLVLLGVATGLESLNLEARNPDVERWVDFGLQIAWTTMAALVAMRIVNAILKAQELRHEGDPVLDRDIKTRANLIRKLSGVLIFGTAAVFLLQIGRVDLTPLIAGSAIGGLVLGLALQETLGNVFAGIALNLDRPARIGDLVRLESGQEGFIEDVSWRYTKIRLWSNALLVVPNSKFASSWLINFHRPLPEITVHVEGQVAFDTDLDKAEGVLLGAAKEAMELVSPDEDLEPYVRWRAFLDSGVQFRVFLRTNDPETQYRLSSECIKLIHRRLQEHGIVMPYPVRRVQLENSSKPGEAVVPDDAS